MNLSERIREAVKVIPEKAGGFGLDFTELFGDSALFADVIDALGISVRLVFDAVAGIDAMGLPFAAAIAARNRLPLFLVRHAGMAAGETVIGEQAITTKSGVKYSVSPAIKGRKVLLLDDTIASGITMSAAIKAVRLAGAEVVALRVVIDMPLRIPELADIKPLSLCTLDAHSLPSK